MSGLNAFRMLMFGLIPAVLLLSACVQPTSGRGESELLAPIPVYGAAPLIRVKLSKPSQASTATVKAGKASVTLDGRRVETEDELVLTFTDGRVNAGE